MKEEKQTTRSKTNSLFKVVNCNYLHLEVNLEIMLRRDTSKISEIKTKFQTMEMTIHVLIYISNDRYFEQNQDNNLYNFNHFILHTAAR